MWHLIFTHSLPPQISDVWSNKIATISYLEILSLFKRPDDFTLTVYNRDAYHLLQLVFKIGDSLCNKLICQIDFILGKYSLLFYMFMNERM